MNHLPVSSSKREPTTNRVLPLCHDGYVRIAKTVLLENCQSIGNILIRIERLVFAENIRYRHAVSYEPLFHECRCGDRLNVWRIKDSTGAENSIVYTLLP